MTEVDPRGHIFKSLALAPMPQVLGAAQEISKDFWKLILLPALESWKNNSVS